MFLHYLHQPHADDQQTIQIDNTPYISFMRKPNQLLLLNEAPASTFELNKYFFFRELRIYCHAIKM